MTRRGRGQIFTRHLAIFVSKGRNPSGDFVEKLNLNLDLFKISPPPPPPPTPPTAARTSSSRPATAPLSPRASPSPRPTAPTHALRLAQGSPSRSLSTREPASSTRTTAGRSASCCSTTRARTSTVRLRLRSLKRGGRRKGARCGDASLSRSCPPAFQPLTKKKKNRKTNSKKIKKNPKNSKNIKTVKAGDRVAQLILERIATPQVLEVEDLDDTARGTGGYGSTGVKS